MPVLSVRAQASKPVRAAPKSAAKVQVRCVLSFVAGRSVRWRRQRDASGRGGESNSRSGEGVPLLALPVARSVEPLASRGWMNS